MTTRYEMNDAQFSSIMEACQPVAAIMLQCGPLRSPQENANNAWKRLADEMGFEWDSVRPSGQGDRVFFATPKEKSPQ